jgi:hypothetical protein
MQFTPGFEIVSGLIYNMHREDSMDLELVNDFSDSASGKNHLKSRARAV